MRCPKAVFIVVIANPSKAADPIREKLPILRTRFGIWAGASVALLTALKLLPGSSCAPEVSTTEKAR